MKRNTKHTATLDFKRLYTDSVKQRVRLQALNADLLTALEGLIPSGIMGSVDPSHPAVADALAAIDKAKKEGETG